MSQLRSSGLNHTFTADLESLWKVSQWHAPKSTKVFKLCFLLSCSWAYTWNTLFGILQFDGHLKAWSSSKDPILWAQLSLTNSPLDYQLRALGKSVKTSKTKKTAEYLGMLLFIVWHVESIHIEHHTLCITVNPSVGKHRQGNCSWMK